MRFSSTIPIMVFSRVHCLGGVFPLVLCVTGLLTPKGLLSSPDPRVMSHPSAIASEGVGTWSAQGRMWTNDYFFINLKMHAFVTFNISEISHPVDGVSVLIARFFSQQPPGCDKMQSLKIFTFTLHLVTWYYENLLCMVE